MNRNFAKIVAIVLAVLLLLSVGAVALSAVFGW